MPKYKNSEGKLIKRKTVSEVFEAKDAILNFIITYDKMAVKKC